MQKRNQFLKIITYIALALVLKFLVADNILKNTNLWWLQAILLIIVFSGGIGYVFRGTAKVIEETTDVLKDRTNLVGGFLQAFGTAFPDRVIGVVAAFFSLQVRSTDYLRAINLALLQLQPLLALIFTIFTCNMVCLSAKFGKSKTQNPFNVSLFQSWWEFKAN